jgi:predicted nucleic acid-binding protein
MRRVVVDTSALAAIAFAEPDATRWAQAIDGAELHAPELLRYELASVARKKCRAVPNDTRGIVTALALTLDDCRGIVWHDANPTDLVLLANATGLSPYDASYLWLAGFLGADLVTADRDLAAAHDAFALV